MSGAGVGAAWSRLEPPFFAFCWSWCMEPDSAPGLQTSGSGAIAEAAQKDGGSATLLT